MKPAQHYRKYLREIVNEVEAIIRVLDTVLKAPVSGERGKKLAKLVNALEMAKDRAKRFGLADPPKIKRGKKECGSH